MAINLEQYGIHASEIVYNPSYEMLFEEEMKPELTGYDKGQLTELDAVNVMTGIFTGRSPKDKYIVMDENSKDTVWWTTEGYPNDNHVMSEETWAAMKDIAVKQLDGKRLFVMDCFCGANADTRMAVRFILEVAWQAHFIKNMFIVPTDEELENFEPDFVCYNASKAKVENYKDFGLNSETVAAFNVTSKEQVIINTWYGGEMKKGLFSMMNYYLPLKGIAAMHCSANTDMNGEHTAIFFGLSGTGKTTLSTDPKRLLIGDDEHGWDDNGVFNFEGGCYAKVINLDKDSEPDIYNAIRRNALLENVTVDGEGKIDFADKSVTETRASPRTPACPTRSTTSRRSSRTCARSRPARLPTTSSSCRLTRSASCRRSRSSRPSRRSTTSCPASRRSSPAPSAASPSPPRRSPLASARHSSSCTRRSTPKSSSSAWSSPAPRPTWSTPAGTAPASASPSRIRAASSTPSLTAACWKPRPR